MRAAQVSAGAVAKVVLVAALVVAGLYFVYLIREVIGLVAIAGFFALAVAPPVDRLHHRVGMPRWLSILIVYFGIGAAIFGIGLLLVPPLVEGVEGLSEDIPGYIDDLRENESFREYDDRYGITSSIEDQASELPSKLDDAAGTLRDVTVGVFSSVVQLFVILVISILAGSTTYITLTALDVPFAIPLAITFAFFDLIPLVGATIGGILIGLVVAITSFPVGLIIWLVVLLVYQQIENNLIQPYVYGQAVQIHPLIVIIAILILSLIHI